MHARDALILRAPLAESLAENLLWLRFLQVDTRKGAATDRKILMTVQAQMAAFAAQHASRAVVSPGDDPAFLPGLTIRQLSAAPGVWWLDHFLADAECEALKRVAEGKLAPSRVIDRASGDPAQKAYRTSSHAFLPLYFDETVKVVEDRVAALLQVPFIYGEGLQLLNYQPGQEYRPHYDFFYPDRPSGAKALSVSGQRVITLLMYLDTVEAGGETAFPEIGLTVRPVKGAALLFFNVDFTGAPDYQTLHASLPVVQGEKWVATKWIYERHCFESTALPPESPFP